MCGIFGYWSRDRQSLDAAALSAMAASLAHRGPDDKGVWHQPGRGTGIGNTRLSIIDIGGGHQPFVSDDGMIAVVQNGEIFNYVELAAELRRKGVRLDTQSDTEVILRLYEHEGIEGVQKLNGMFAIAIDDAREELRDAREAYKDRDYDDAVDFAEDAEETAEEATEGTPSEGRAGTAATPVGGCGLALTSAVARSGSSRSSTRHGEDPPGGGWLRVKEEREGWRIRERG